MTFYLKKNYYSEDNIPISQLKASSNPFPVFATVLNIAHWLFFISLKPIISEICISDNDSSKSCLFANIAIGTPCKSSSCINKNSSCFTIFNLSLSVESITKTIAFVFGK